LKNGPCHYKRDLEGVCLCLRSSTGEFHDHRDAKGIVIRGQVRGHNDTPFGRRGVGHPQGVFGVFSYYQLVILFFNIVPLIMEFIHLIAEFTLSIDSSSWPPAKQFVLNINRN
jgi:hypothetical protein